MLGIVPLKGTWVDLTGICFDVFWMLNRYVLLVVAGRAQILFPAQVTYGNNPQRPHRRAQKNPSSVITTIQIVNQQCE